MYRPPVLASALIFVAVAGLTGCGVNGVDHSSSGTLAISGKVHGGQQPVVGSVIQLYTVGSAGNASAATSMLTLPVVSIAGGNFAITGDYHCGETGLGTSIGSPSNQVYIVARGGNPGLTAGTDNSALVLMAALGDCSKLSAATYIEINEVTTVAAAWALGPFMTSSTNVGATATNVSGIENAFLDAGLLADTSTGLATALPGNLSVETGKLYGLADAIASCVNSNGGAACTPLFTAAKPTGGAVPTDTLTAALNIVKHPGQNVTAVYNTIGSAPPFPTTLTKAPSDWTMSLTITGGGLFMPSALGIDEESNVWVAGQIGPLSAFGPQGAPLSATGYGTVNGVSDLRQTNGLTIDSAGDIWITDFNSNNYPQGSVVEFYGTNAASPHAMGDAFTDAGYGDGISYPTAVAADNSGNIFVANNGNGTATVYSSAGVKEAAFLGGNFTPRPQPLAIAVDSTGGYWMPDSGYTVAHVGGNGSLISHPMCCYDSDSVATDAQGNAWVSNYLDSTFSEVSKTGMTTINRQSTGGVTYPQALMIDAAQNVWFANYLNGTISEVAGTGGTLAAGTGISPSTGYGMDISLIEPLGIAPDRSGNIWLTNGGLPNVVMFFGLAAPTATPIRSVPTNP